MTLSRYRCGCGHVGRWFRDATNVHQSAYNHNISWHAGGQSVTIETSQTKETL